MLPSHRFDVAKLVADLGGPAYLARVIGVSRTTPYRWINRSYLSSPVMERIKDAFPTLNLDPYFTTTGDNDDDGHLGGRSARRSA